MAQDLTKFGKGVKMLKGMLSIGYSNSWDMKRCQPLF
jgi:hypothetical protein